MPVLDPSRLPRLDSGADPDSTMRTGPSRSSRSGSERQ